MSRELAIFLHRMGTPTAFFVVSVLISLLLFLVGETSKGMLFLMALVMVSGLAGLLKIIFRVARPIDAVYELSSFAFPSGHSAGIAFLMVGVLYILHDVVALGVFYGIALLLLILVALIGVSRVVLRVHTTFQVLVGLTIGFGVSLLIFINGDIILSILQNTL